MRKYLDFMRYTRDTGVFKSDRTGTGTTSIFGYQMRFNLEEGFPLLTTKKLHLKSIIHELIWFLAGDTNIKYLKDQGVTIWDDWADAQGELGPVYGYQWRSWPGGLVSTDGTPLKADAEGVVWVETGDLQVAGIKQEGIDQISNLIHMLKTNPDSRRLIVTAWNPAQVDQMKLPPCHCLFQFYTTELTLEERARIAGALPVVQANSADLDPEYLMQQLDLQHIPRRRLSCQLYQRSADIFLGVPFNIASYALLTMMIAQQCNMIASEFIWTGGDCHLYSNHADQVETQLVREPGPLPKMTINRRDSLFDYRYEDFVLSGYEHAQPSIKAPVAV